ncbi:hypothetical protein M407DRAFT_35190, partial [Tulasnella calospora MUT 4182]
NPVAQTVVAVTRGVRNLLFGTTRRYRNEDSDRDSVSTWSGEEQTYEEYVDRVIREEAAIRATFEASTRATFDLTGRYEVQRNEYATLVIRDFARHPVDPLDSISTLDLPPSLVPAYADVESPSPITPDEAVTPEDGPTYFVADTVSLVDSDTFVDSEPEEGEIEEDIDPLAINLPDIPDLRIAGIPINRAYLSINQNGSINLNLVNALRDAVQIDSGELSEELWYVREQRQELREQREGAHQEAEELRITLDELQEQVDRIEETHNRILALPTINELEFFRDSTIFRNLSKSTQEIVLDAIRQKQAEVPVAPQVQ